MTNERKSILSPTLPVVGETIRLFGLKATVRYVEPNSDWSWDVTVRWADDTISVLRVPTDYRTDDNVFFGDL
jgi:hypothetical protein